MDNQSDDQLKNRIRSGVERDLKACMDLAITCITDMNDPILKLQSFPIVSICIESDSYIDKECELDIQYISKIQSLKSSLIGRFNTMK